MQFAMHSVYYTLYRGQCVVCSKEQDNKNKYRINTQKESDLISRCVIPGYVATGASTRTFEIIVNIFVGTF